MNYLFRALIFLTLLEIGAYRLDYRSERIVVIPAWSEAVFVQQSSSGDQREMLSKIRARIGPDIIQQFTNQVCQTLWLPLSWQCIWGILEVPFSLPESFQIHLDTLPSARLQCGSLAAIPRACNGWLAAMMHQPKSVSQHNVRRHVNHCDWNASSITSILIFAAKQRIFRASLFCPSNPVYLHLM